MGSEPDLRLAPPRSTLDKPRQSCLHRHMRKHLRTIREPGSGASEGKHPRFTRVELLVATTLAAVLVGCAGPAMQQAQKKAQQNKAMQQAMGIAKALRVYSYDNDALYPSGDNANLAFAQMFPELGSEDPFYVRSSAWHGRGRTAGGPDNLWGEDGEDGQALEPGENHWAFNIAAADDSHPSIPLIADGFSNQIGTYSTDPSELGGVWGGRSAIVVFCNLSAKIVRLDQNQKFTNPRESNRDEFARHGVEMVNPAKPSS